MVYAFSGVEINDYQVRIRINTSLFESVEVSLSTFNHCGDVSAVTEKGNSLVTLFNEVAHCFFSPAVVITCDGIGTKQLGATVNANNVHAVALLIR